MELKRRTRGLFAFCLAFVCIFVLQVFGSPSYEAKAESYYQYTRVGSVSSALQKVGDSATFIFKANIDVNYLVSGPSVYEKDRKNIVVGWAGQDTNRPYGPEETRDFTLNGNDLVTTNLSGLEQYEYVITRITDGYTIRHKQSGKYLSVAQVQSTYIEEANLPYVKYPESGHRVNGFSYVSDPIVVLSDTPFTWTWNSSGNRFQTGVFVSDKNSIGYRNHEQKMYESYFVSIGGGSSLDVYEVYWNDSSISNATYSRLDFLYGTSSAFQLRNKTFALQALNPGVETYWGVNNSQGLSLGMQNSQRFFALSLKGVRLIGMALKITNPNDHRLDPFALPSPESTGEFPSIDWQNMQLYQKNEVQTYSNIKVNFRLNGFSYSGFTSDYTNVVLENKANSDITYRSRTISTENPLVQSTATFNNVISGDYSVVIDGIPAPGITLTVNAADVATNVDFHTIIVDPVATAGFAAAGATISATASDGFTLNLNKPVLKNRELIFSVSGISGADRYAYRWHDNSTASSLKLSVSVARNVGLSLSGYKSVALSGGNQTIPYTGSAIYVSDYFDIDSNAGAATYTHAGGSGDGSLNGTTLTVNQSGTFNVRLDTAQNGYYDVATHSIVLTVTKGESNTTLTVNPSQSTYGEEVLLTATVTNNGIPVIPEGGTVTFKYGSDVLAENIAVDSEGIATYTVAADILQPGMGQSLSAEYSGYGIYSGSTGLINNYDVSKATQAALTTPDGLSVTYGETITLSAGGGTAGSFVYTVENGGTGNGKIQNDSLTGTKAGTVAVNVSRTGNDFYNEVSASFLVQVLEREIVLPSGITANDKIYDGSTAATLIMPALTTEMGYITGDDITLSATGSFSDKHVGSKKYVTIQGLTIEGNDKDNYYPAASGQQTDTTANISARPVTIDVDIADKAYDGTTDAVIASAAISDKVSGDDLTITTPYPPVYFADSGAADNISIGFGSGVFVLQGADVNNYSLTQPSGLMANIQKAILTIIPDTGQSKVIDGSTASNITYKVGGLAPGESIASMLTGALELENGSVDLGLHNIVQGSLNCSGIDPNYSSTLDFRSGVTFEIKPSDKRELLDLVEEIEKIIDDLINDGGIGNGEGQYEQSDIDDLKDALSDAKDVINNDRATEAQTQQAIDDLKDAFDVFENSRHAILARSDANKIVLSKNNVALGEKFTFIATGDRQIISGKVVEGDTQFIPNEWSINPFGVFPVGGPYEAEVALSSTGEFTLTVSFLERRWTNGAWQNVGAAVTQTAVVTVYSTSSSYYDPAPSVTGTNPSVNRGTGTNTTAPDGTETNPAVTLPEPPGNSTTPITPETSPEAPVDTLSPEPVPTTSGEMSSKSQDSTSIWPIVVAAIVVLAVLLIAFSRRRKEQE